ncbi:LPS O-antigen chain length determinant protein WzzB [Jejubacter calystegiae]|uniref:Chain length determinant protein n=1 Tax=Jejubacter calystegiae TaxID=2579935 RepID=A0A4P8YMF2_9ENTR|nr:LPS O-antigen chain length determinant protein WzzB [Jejubacter calystegiae]QCT22025.1 LPS O-antigen chain length determinant protein WzzB [Jejubacter calystegiae]
MNQNSQAAQGVSRSPETVDLLDLLMQLWRGKKTIIAFVIIFILLTVAYLFVAKEKWSSSAIVTLPDSGQIANYSNSMGIIYSQNRGSAPSVSDIQNRFFTRFNSLISALSEELDNQEKPESLAIEPAVKGQSVPLKISYVGSSAEEARKTLTAYIDKINQRVIDELNADLVTNINATMKDLKSSLDAQEASAKAQREQRLEILRQALKVAEQSNIKDTMVRQAETLSEDTLFVLGTDALSATLKNESTRPLPLKDQYYNTLQSYLAVKALAQKPDISSSFHYVMKPNLPVRRDSPKRGLTLVLAALLGGMIGSGVVLVRNALRNYKPAA